MRFEIRVIGWLGIFLGLGMLSIVVFCLGLMSGYEMGRQQDDNRQFATIYPLPSPPAIEATPMAGKQSSPPAAVAKLPAMTGVSPPTPAAVEASVPAASVSPLGFVALPPVPPAPVAPVPPAVPASVAKASSNPAPVAHPAPVRMPAESMDTGDNANTEVASAPEPDLNETRKPNASSSPKRQGYSIQIEAIMDKAGADGMVAKLRRLGYKSSTVPTQIAGQTWYRVRVGPYATRDEARVAEQKLHDQYGARFSTH